MKKKSASFVLVFCLALCFIMVGSLSAFAEVAVENYPGEATVKDIYAAAQEKSEANKPRVTTLPNGVQVQRTTDDVGGYWHRPGNYNSYNTFYLNADNRGCAACHSDLVTLLDTMSYEHLDFSNTYGIDMEVQDCMICHDDGNGYLYTVHDFGTLIHGIHTRSLFNTMGGGCMSCHNATADGLRSGPNPPWRSGRSLPLPYPPLR